MNNLSAERLKAVSVAVLWQRIDFEEKERLLDAEWFANETVASWDGYGVASVYGREGLLYALLIFNRAVSTENRGRGGCFCCCNPLFLAAFLAFPALAFL